MVFKAKFWVQSILLEPFTVMVHVNHSPMKQLQSTKINIYSKYYSVHRVPRAVLNTLQALSHLVLNIVL